MFAFLPWSFTVSLPVSSRPRGSSAFSRCLPSSIWKTAFAREKALLDRGREETGNSTVKLQGKGANIEGLAVADMTKDQREGVRGVLRDLLAPFRKEDADEAMKYVDAAGFENIHMAFYKAGDIGKDGVWDVWQLEGPNMVWYFRGSPHVHVWVNIAASA